ncbi:ATP-binding protein [Desulfobacterales bacterium HSG16]|nr:ATP-binding protein [Desulfobacterales bacterium HSG16]
MNITTKNQKSIILIIDDNITNIKVIAKHLNDNDFITIVARNGQAGLERARFSQPDLILLDVLMPGMDGFETCRCLKADEFTKDIPVLFMTVLSETSDKLKGFESGGLDYVTKPIQEEEVLARITTHLNLRKLQKCLEEKNAKLHFQAMLMDQIKDSIFSTDMEGRITYINQAAVRSFRKTQEEVIGKTVCVLGESPEYTAVQNKIIKKTLSDGKWQGKVVNYDKSGTEHIFETKTWLIHDKNGEHKGMVSTSTDITEQANMQDALVKAKETAETASKAKGAFLANMGHELRSPLNSIIGFSRIMARDKNLSSEYQKNLDVIHRSGEHLLSLIDDVLNMSSINAGNATLAEEDFDIYSLMDDMRNMFRLKADEKALSLDFYLASDLPRYVRTDETKLRQVLINLFSNAIKFTNEGSVICRLSLAATSNRQPATGNQQSIYFEVEDTGLGIDRDELPNIFEPFIQAREGKKSRKGTGLGLSISQKYVQLMGGEISAGSEPGRGSVFTFDIQVSLPEALDNNMIRQISPDVVLLESDQLRISKASTIESALISDRLKALPDQWYIDLKTATRVTDPEKSNAVIQQIREKDEILADFLADLLEQYRFDIIQELLEKNEKEMSVQKFAEKSEE